MHRIKALLGLFLLCGLTILSAPAFAILVRPIVIELTAIGSSSTTQIEVVNDRNKPMAVEVRPKVLVLPEQGPPVTDTPADGDFLIFPTIANIPAGGRQVFRVRYVGDPAITQSKLYMFSTSELPVDANPEGGKAQIEMLYSIGSVVAVRPVQGKPEISVVAVARGADKDGKPGVTVTFENIGRTHGYVAGSTLDLKSDAGWSKQLDAAAMNTKVGLGLVPANAKRTMFVELPDVPADGNLSGSVRIRTDQ
ncbi:fimbria/pilus periplasmic chaperone [Sphingopyxis sp. BSN-002]|uniref:fimbria/pilus periplasmic chaperone n=1 Tax=Sphingopyxis sp. BSN-002 TaxID=2911495 RepID=UPI001EDA9047|nr:fimbria/pilus periplasmic chaperone [Sphingopyxis sp. BSN-002]UKK83146.1 fimbria/pilus periplasmic chaperone [Sphingopyxis sp. BSN-002]